MTYDAKPCGAPHPSVHLAIMCRLEEGHSPVAKEVGGKMYEHADPQAGLWWDALPTDAVYPPILRVSEPGDKRFPHRVDVVKQDDVAPPGEFRMVRKMIAEGSPVWNGYSVMVECYRNPVREYPPMHVGSSGAGMILNLTEARALRDALSAWIAENEEENDGLRPR